MNEKMVCKHSIAKAIERNFVLFHRKIDEDILATFVESYHTYLPKMNEEQFAAVDAEVVKRAKFFPLLSDYVNCYSELYGDKKWY